MIQLSNVSFTYKNTSLGVRGIDLRVREGECIVLVGASGCGKTTLTRLVNGLAPRYYEGTLSGSLIVEGKDITGLKSWEIGRLVGSVFQDPKSQFFSSDLAGEVAFACENYGMTKDKIRSEAEDAIRIMGLEGIRDRRLDVISSGEKQRTAIASIYALKPKIYVCDEPTANLDPEGVEQLRNTLSDLKRNGCTLLIAEHRIAWLMGLADRFVYLEEGQIRHEYRLEDLQSMSDTECYERGLRSPQGIRLPDLPKPEASENDIVKIHKLEKRKGQVTIFEGLQAAFPKGSVSAITGRNGSGKTTLGLILAGLARQGRGEILVCGRRMNVAQRRREIYYCSNETGTQFFTPSVAEELLLNQNLTEENKEKARELLRQMGLYEYRDSHPSALSGGQKQRLAIACALFSGRNVLIFDEPTSGLDGKNMQMIAALLKDAAGSGRTVIVITHDAELMRACCDYRFRFGKEDDKGET